MHIFGSTCYVSKNLTRKRNPKRNKVIFVGYDWNTPSYLVFYPGNKRVLKHRLVKFITKMTNQQTQIYSTNNDDDDEDDFFQKKNIQKQKSVMNPDLQIEISDWQDNTHIEEDSKLRHYPRRERKAPQYLNDYITNSEEDSDQELINIDYCYKATCNIPLSYKEALNSSKAHCWNEGCLIPWRDGIPKGK